LSTTDIFNLAFQPSQPLLPSTKVPSILQILSTDDIVRVPWSPLTDIQVTNAGTTTIKPVSVILNLTGVKNSFQNPKHM
jgi:hypothetical protein